MLKTAGPNSSHQADESVSNCELVAKRLNLYGVFEFCSLRSVLDGAATLHA